MAKTDNTIVIERESAWTYALGTMNVVIDDFMGIKLNNGESKKISLPKGKTEFFLQVKDHKFRVVNIKQIKKIVLKFSFVGVQCSVIYKNGEHIDAVNKNPGADVTKTIWIIIFLFLIIIPTLTGLLELIGLAIIS